ncbi:hypothetical protein Tco_0657472 [Tanacetum coccineum]|uniref:Retrovirus-related Pol polyprotein from transposon TNT 1-94-like beta-barrel domain-containing protein n=1 Tax=Tanacetum coccineum TaxID=301880 RepID=A0ABQ4XCH2_9ASTR
MEVHLRLQTRPNRKEKEEKKIKGCDVALEIIPLDMEANEKATLMKKTYSTKLGDHIDEFNKLILNFTNIDIEIEDEDHALMLLTSLPSPYENFVEKLLYRRESLTMKDVITTLNSRELKKRTKGKKEETGDGLYGHLKKDCPMKNSSGFVKKGKRDQDSDSSDDEVNAYFGEALVVVENDEMTEMVMDSRGSYHMTHMRSFLYDLKGFNGGSIQLGDNKTCTIKGTGKVKIRLHDGSNFILKDVRYVPRLKRSLISLGILEKEGYTMKMQMGRIKGAQGDHKAEVFQVSNDDVAVAKKRLEDKQFEEKTNTDCLVKEQGKGNVAEKKRVKESMEANLGKLLKYNAW